MQKESGAALLEQDDPKENTSLPILSPNGESVKSHDLKKILELAGISPKRAVGILREKFPSLDKTVLSKCCKPEKYGCVLHPDGFQVLIDKCNLAPPPAEPEAHATPATASSDTQCARILRHMRDYGSITSLEAMKEYGIMRLASRITDLKRQGYVIESTTEAGKNRYGEATRYARYTLKEAEQDGHP